MVIYRGTGADDRYTNVTPEPLLAYGYGGNDNFWGNSAADSLYGGSGNDALFGRGEDDYLVGGAGNDYLYGDTGDDSLYGGYRHDTLYGDYGNDILYGGDGHDRLTGEQDNDILLGGRGNDLLVGYISDITSTDFDTLTGGAGADTFVLGESDTRQYSVYVFVGYQGDGYATITDFSRRQGDQIQVAGSITDYSLDKSVNLSGGSALDTGIYYGDDLIAVVQDTTKVYLSVDFNFV